MCHCNKIGKIIATIISIVLLLGVVLLFMWRCMDYSSCWLLISSGLGVMVYCIIVFIIKSLLIVRIGGYSGLPKVCNKPKFIKCIECFIIVLSFDYAIADFNKESIPKHSRAYYIEASNQINLFVSTILVTIGYIILHFANDNECIVSVCIAFMFTRFASRTMEVNIAFVRDILKDTQKSSLTNKKRIKLAFTSLLEEAILFAFTYVTFAKDTGLDCCEIIKSVFNGLQSLSIDSADYQTCCRCIKCIQFLSLYQGLCAIILGTISFATYISGSKCKDMNYFKMMKMGNNNECIMIYDESCTIKQYNTNTSQTYPIDDYDLKYSKDGCIEYLVSKMEYANREVIINRVLYLQNAIKFSDYLDEIKEIDYNEFKEHNDSRDEYHKIKRFSLENGALKTAVGLRKIFVPRELDYLPCSFARLFTLRCIWYEGEKIIKDNTKNYYLPRLCRYKLWPSSCK